MLIVRSWNDLKNFGIDCLTGEACGLSMRLLCDLTERGQRIVEKLFDVKIQPPEAWNNGDPPHVGCVMLPLEMFMPLAIFSLLEVGCKEVFRDGDVLFGIEQDDTEEYLALFHKGHPHLRRYAYSGTAGSRNVHVMSGRTI
jgi:hypothetical protein